MSEWIWFGDRKPEIGQIIMAYSVSQARITGGRYMGIEHDLYRIDTAWYHEGMAAVSNWIVASYWMPLPELPEEVE